MKTDHEQQEADLEGSEAPAAQSFEGPEGLERLLGELDAARAQAEENQNNYLRAVAEAENVRKRTQRDLEAARRFAIEGFAAELLDVIDSLELGIAAGDGAASGLTEGMEATLRLLQRAFEKSGIAVVDPRGEPFDPELHEAMTVQETSEVPEGTVLEVFQKGYVLNGRLLRPARVIIAKAPA
jgi:molecular chaperone GrpE